MKFKTKAQNLEKLSNTNIKIPKIYKFKVKDYKSNANKILKQIKMKFLIKLLLDLHAIMDSLNSLMAGVFVI